MRLSGKAVVAFISKLQGKHHKSFWQWFNSLPNQKKAQVLQSYIVDYVAENAERFETFIDNVEFSASDRIIEVVARKEFAVLLEYVFETQNSTDAAFAIDTAFRYISTNYEYIRSGRRRDAKPFVLVLVSLLYDIDIEISDVSKRYIQTNINNAERVLFAKTIDDILDSDIEYSIRQQQQQPSPQKTTHTQLSLF